MTLLSLATAVRARAGSRKCFPQHLTTSVEHRFDAQKQTRRRLESWSVITISFIEQTPQQRDLDPGASGRCLAEAAPRRSL